MTAVPGVPKSVRFLGLQASASRWMGTPNEAIGPIVRERVLHERAQHFAELPTYWTLSEYEEPGVAPSGYSPRSRQLREVAGIVGDQCSTLT